MLEGMKQSARQLTVHSGVRFIHVQSLEPGSHTKALSFIRTPATTADEEWMDR